MTQPHLIPRPRVVVHGDALRSSGENTLAGAVTDRIRSRAQALPAVGVTLRFEIAGSAEAIPSLDVDESYSIDWSGDDVRIKAIAEWGALTALSTLCQVMGQGRSVRRVDDRPGFSWRGLMIDVARRFMPVATLDVALEGMWLTKLNVLHLHLSDDQGFRFRSERFPELASDDGAYEADELRGLVARAADRGIRIVPELDVPGHVSSWLLKHPEWAVAGTAPSKPVREFGVHQSTLNPASPAVIAAVDTLFGELAAVFPDEFQHFGGDEVAIKDWTRDPSIAEWVDETGVSPKGVQARFNEHIVGLIHDRGRRAIGWDEALHETLDRRTVVEVWRGAKGRDNALRAGFDVVVSAPYYLDLLYPGAAHYAYGPGDDFTKADAAVRAIDRMVHVVPGLDWIDRIMTYPDLDARGTSGRLLGGEACLWSELVRPGLLSERLWSRLPLVADRFWRSRRGSVAAMEAANVWLMDFLVERGVAERASPPAELGVLGQLLEPVKWYRRLLGPAYEARVENRNEAEVLRTYTVDSPLTNLVDVLHTESPFSKTLEAEIDAGRWPDTAGWRIAESVLNERGDHDLRNAAQALCALADVVDACGANRTSPLDRTDIEACAGPFGELLLPIAYAIARRVGQGTS